MMDYEGGGLLAGWCCLRLVVGSLLRAVFAGWVFRAFGAAGPRLWNSLPSHLKDADISYSEFRPSLKTFLFGQWGQGAV